MFVGTSTAAEVEPHVKLRLPYFRAVGTLNLIGQMIMRKRCHQPLRRNTRLWLFL